MPAATVVETPSTRDWAVLAVPGLIWGMSFYFIAEGLEMFPAMAITPARIGLGALALAPLRAARAPVPRSAWPGIALLAVVWMAVPLTMFPLAEERVSSSLTGMLNGATPLFVAVVGAAVYGLRSSRAQRAGLLVGFAGVVLIAAPAAGDGGSSAVGVALILVALVCYGFSLHIARPLQQSHGVLAVLWRSQLVAFAVTMPLAAGATDDIEFLWGPFLMIVALGVLGTGVAHAVTAGNTARFGATRASASLYLTPVISLVLGAVLRDEDVYLASVIGCAVALLGAYLAGRTD